MTHIKNHTFGLVQFKIVCVLFTKSPSFGKSQLLNAPTLANQNKAKMARKFKNLKISQFGFFFFLKMKYKSRLTSASIAGCDLCEVSVVIPLHFEIKHFTLCVTGLCNEELVEETLKVQKNVYEEKSLRHESNR